MLTTSAKNRPIPRKPLNKMLLLSPVRHILHSIHALVFLSKATCLRCSPASSRARDVTTEWEEVQNGIETSEASLLGSGLTLKHSGKHHRISCKIP